MAMYVPDCAPARTILVEHDITYDLYAQMLATGSDDWEIRRQHQLWTSFETAAWHQVDRVVTMSEKDRALIDAEQWRFPTASIWTASSRHRNRPIREGCCSSDPLRIGPT